MDKDVALAQHAKHHHGIFRIRHALMAGLSRGQIEHRIESGLWEQIYKDVFRLTGVPPSWYGDVLAACWAGGFRAAASHRCATALFGLPGGDRRSVEIICPRWRRARHKGLVVHESKALSALDVTVIHGIPVTTPARTLFDLGGVRRAGVVELALEAALRKGLVSIAELDAAVRRLSRSGRPGGPVLRGLLEARAPDRRPTDSDMESRLVQAIRLHGLPEPVTQHEVWDGGHFVARVDLAYPDVRIAIEYDSDEFHTGRVAADRDRSRRHLLLAAGWLTIDVGAADLRRGAAGACAAIAAALSERRVGGFGVASSAGN
jgi:very-short-patch-repair endonuclease